MRKSRGKVEEKSRKSLRKVFELCPSLPRPKFEKNRAKNEKSPGKISKKGDHLVVWPRMTPRMAPYDLPFDLV